MCNKPAGLMVEPDRNNFPNLLQQVRQYLKGHVPGVPPYVQHLHRLDRPVSGVVLFTKQKTCLRNLSEQFAQRSVSKYYMALTAVEPAASTSTLEHWHRKEKKKAVLVPEGTAHAERVKLDYRAKPSGQYVLWEIRLHTGKFHQIRVQLAGIGCPILGDYVYGSIVPFAQDAIALHAARLMLRHPVTGEDMAFEAPMPEGFLRLSRLA